MYRYTLLLLDLDGTLMDFEEAELRALKGCFTEFGLEPSQKNIKTYLAVNDALWHELTGSTRSCSALRGRQPCKASALWSRTNICCAICWRLCRTAPSLSPYPSGCGVFL